MVMNTQSVGISVKMNYLLPMTEQFNKLTKNNFKMSLMYKALVEKYEGRLLEAKATLEVTLIIRWNW